MTEFYYGLPEHVWDNLSSEAENLLYEKNIGQHVIGLYPAGNRIFGDESSPPGLMCLYLDSVEPLIDPFSNYYTKNIHLIESKKSKIIFVDFFKWVMWHKEMINSFKWTPIRDMFLHMIPFGRHSVYEDISISSIIDAIAEISIKGAYYPCIWDWDPDVSKLNFNRTEAIIAKHKVFMPCRNKKWDEVFTLDIEKDTTKTEKELNKLYKGIIYKYRLYKQINENKFKEISKMVMDLYRFQM